MTQLTSNIQKGGALLDDTRRLVEVWDPTLSADENLDQILEANLLAKASRSRLEDVLARILAPRFIDPGEEIIAALRHLLIFPHAFREACYFETTRDDTLLAAFAEGPLFEWYDSGRTTIPIDDVRGWLSDLHSDGQIPDWSESVRTKTARGLLAALRDFGVLKGTSIKEFATPQLSPRGFSYVAFRLHDAGNSSRAMVASPVWRRWLLDESRVDDLLVQAERLGVLRYSQTGSAFRIDWLARSLEEVASAAA